MSNDLGNAGFGQKVFPIPHLNAGLTYVGTYEINGKSAQDWLNDFIAGSFFLYAQMDDFVKALTRLLNSEMREIEFKKATIIHVCGYQTHNSKSYIQHWHISNVTLDLPGEYSDPRTEFDFYTDFDTFKNAEHRELIISNTKIRSNRQYFINGFTSGRYAANYVIGVLETTLSAIWNMGQFRFRAPANIFETANVLRLYYTIIIELFKISEYNAMYIGGEIQTYLLPMPPNIDLESI
ncbi:MAG: hypothetical protein ACJ75B_20820 [Flavisolibacter sp.]